MRKKYVRKTNRQTWCKEDMRNACEAVQRKEMGWLKASKTFNIPASTLRRHALGMNKVLRKNEKGMGKNSFYNPLKDAENNMDRITSTEHKIAVKQGSSTDHIKTEIMKIEKEFLDPDGESLGISTRDEDIFAEEEDTVQNLESNDVLDQEPKPNQIKKEKQSSDKVVYKSAKRRKYVRKTNRQTWCKEDMRNACEAVQRREMGWLKASKTFNIPASTLRRHALGMNKVLQKNEKGMGRNSFYNPLKDAENNINRITSTENEIAVKQGSSTDHIETEIMKIENEFLDPDGESLGISTQDEDIFAEEEDTIEYLESSEVSDKEFDIFGTLVAAILKNMPLQEAVRLQMKVHKLMADFRIELFLKMSNENEVKTKQDI